MGTFASLLWFVHMDLDLYAQAVSTDQQEAHRKVVQIMLPTRFPEQLKERSTAATA
jgi:hypothetical protein